MELVFADILFCQKYDEQLQHEKDIWMLLEKL